MGIFDFLTPKADGLAYDPMRLPAGADPENDPVLNYDDLGRKIYTSQFDGTQYLFEMAPPKTQSVIKGAYREATANPLGFTGDLLSNAVQSAWDAISVPRRAMEGQPLTYGDIAGLTGMMTLGAGAGTAPAGALRMGAAREGRPPVTFADAERAMQETPGIRAYQGSPHNFAAERLVRMPDGSTQYIVGKPDVLPDVPAGAEVLQDFPLGRMRMDKLGTGEGAQVYGPGLYTAENERVAKEYRDALSRSLNSDDLGRNLANYAVSEKRGSIDNAVSYLKKEMDYYENRPAGWPSSNIKKQYEDALSILTSGKWNPAGSMYEVNISASPDTFLNWDQPLGQQSEVIRSAFASLGTPDRLASVKGENAYRALEDQSGSIDWPVGASLAERNAARKTAAENARQKLLNAGIPGIKYLDAGSRGKAYTVKLAYKGKPFEEGQFEPQFAKSKAEADSIAKEYQNKGYETKIEEGGSRNYVVFDENLISIVRKYGIAGAAVMLGTSADQISQTLTENMTQEELNNLVSGA